MTRIDVGHWCDRLTVLAEKHGVPGAQLGILVDGVVSEVAVGVLNLGTGVENTPDALFQLGSISKVWTATLVMQLVDEGRLDLDAPVVGYLPELTLADPRVTARVTMRHLLTHTSGIDGDHFLDCGAGEDCLARYVASLAGLALPLPVGAAMSYCNTGYSLAGRVLEVLEGKSWDEVLQDRLVKPLGLTHTWTLPGDVIRYRNALGHLTHPDGSVQPAGQWGLWRTAGPAGLVCAPVRESLAFAGMHLAGGLAPDGTRVLSAASVAAMQAPQVAVADPYTLGAHWGLGWILFDWERGVYGHDGSTIGQNSYLRIIPDRNLALALSCNGGSAAELYYDLFNELLTDLADLRIPDRLEPTPGHPIDTTVLGTYEREGTRIEITRRDAQSHRMQVRMDGPLDIRLPAMDLDLVMRPFADRIWVVGPADAAVWTTAVLFDIGDRAYLHFNARATPRVS
jgi:CubicO group peptidase (beta-lactamase class C family)